MSKTFIIKNIKGEIMGKIIFSQGKFEVNISSGVDKEKIEKLLDLFVKKGIRDLGEVILKQPIKMGDSLFFNEVRNQLARKGYIFIEKDK